MARFLERIGKFEENPIYEKYEYHNSGFIKCAMYSYAKSSKNPVCYYNEKRRHSSKNFEIHPRILDYCSIFVYNTGNFGFIFDNIAYYPSQGDIFVIKNNVEFSSFFPENTYIDYYEITFPMDFFDYFDEKSMFHRLFFDDMEAGAKILSTNKVTAKTIFQKFNELDCIINANTKDTDILSFSYIVQIIGIICSQTNNSLDDIHMEKVPKKLKAAVNYIHENFTDPITIGEVANYCGISNTYLARMFKRIYLTTPHDYITKLRISYAKNLLAKGQGVAEACYNSGFNDYNHFITKFKAATGTTPSKYKKNKA